jgi:ABC-2 type transport system ATP-binding protein
MLNTSRDPSPAIEVYGLTKQYGEFIAVDHISFEVKRGELFGFLGPNGAGKTTTIRMLTGVISKSDGKARVMGFSSGSIEAKQISGVVPELSNVYMDLTGWRNLMLTAELYRVPTAQAKTRAENLLKQLGIYERKNSLAREYSMGMRKRLLLAMALISDPEIIFLDEPTSGLDVQSSRFIRGLLRAIKQGGKTFFLTTHNMSEAADMCDRVAIINRGKLVALDTPENLKITAGRVSLVDISFDRQVSDEALKGIPGVLRLESSQAIDKAERMKAMEVMGGMGPGRMGLGIKGRSMTGKQEMDMPPAEPTEADEKRPPANRFRLHTEDTGGVIASLVDFSHANSLKMNVLNIHPPSLEDAFVVLTEEANHEK